MHVPRRAPTLLSLSLVAATCVALAPAGTARAPAEGVSHPPPSSESAQVVLDWERTMFATVYPATPIPVGVPVLGFTSLAMYDAVRTSLRRGGSSETAAVATAAHDVLLHYYPAAASALQTKLEASLLGVPDGPSQVKGEDVGHDAAQEMLDSRVGDNYLSTSFHYTLAPPLPQPAPPGLWQPVAPVPPATTSDMLAPWLGSLRHVVVRRLARVGGPDGLRSDKYAFDYNEVRRYGGSAATTLRSEGQTQIAQFFNSNAATMVGDALIRYLEANPMGLRRTARLFGAMHGAMTDSAIKCWRLKRDVGFWRPSQAIKRADEDRNPATNPESGWTSLLQPEPPYADYVSGHGCVTSPQVETIRKTLGENTPLRLRSANPLSSSPEELYTHLSDIESDAFDSRIWGGLHFRKAMTDAYSIGHQTARKVLRRLP